MPRFNAKLSDGRTVTLEADSQPSEADILSATQNFGQVQDFKDQGAAQPLQIASPRQPATGEQSATYGGPPKAMPDAAEAAQATGSALNEGFEAAGNQQLNIRRPFQRRFHISPTEIGYDPENPIHAAAYEGANAVLSVPEFLSSPAGAMSIPAAGVAPAATLLGFIGMGAKTLYDTIQAESEPSYLQKDLAEKVHSIGRVTSAGVMTYLPARGGLAMAAERIKANAAKMPQAAKAAAEINASEAEKAAQAAPSAPEGVQTAAAGETPQGEAASPAATPPGVTPEVHSAVETERQALDLPEGSIVYGPEHLDPKQPFAGRQMATINSKGQIVILPEMQRYLEAQPPENRGPVIRATIAEEQNHLATPPEDAGKYWDLLDPVRKALELRMYTGEWSLAKAQAKYPSMGFSPQNLGYEAVNGAFQRLARFNSRREVIDAVGKERWKLETVNALQHIADKVMDGLPVGDDAARQARLEILQRVKANLQIAKGVLQTGTGGAQPAALDKDQAEKGRLEPQKGERWVTVRRPDGTTYEAAFGEYFKGFPGDPAMIAKATPTGWSHGILPKGDTIVERPSPAALNKAPRDIAKDLGIEFRGTMDTPNRSLDQYHDSEGITVSVPKGSNLEQVKAMLEARRAEYAQPIETGNAQITPPAAFDKLHHGTPYEVDKFNTDRIGTGEGHQTYGWGLYFAERPETAQSYAERLAGNLSPTEAQLKAYYQPGEIVKGYVGHDRVLGFDWNKGAWNVTVEAVKKNAQGEWVSQGRPRTHMTAPSAKEMAERNIPGARGNHYTVSVDAEPNEILDWDKPLGQQSDLVRKAVESVRPDLVDKLKRSGYGDEAETQVDQRMTGRDAYNSLISKHSAPMEYRAGAKIASRKLREAGVKGIRFLDQGSRFNLEPPATATKGHMWEVTDGNKVLARESTRELAQAAMDRLQTRNYVVFDHDTIKITHKNGERISAPELQRQQSAQTPAALNKGGTEGDEFLDVPKVPAEQDRSIGASIARLESLMEHARANGKEGAAMGYYDTIQKLKEAFPHWAERSFPAAFNKRPDTLTDQMFLPPVTKGEAVNREGFKPLTGNALDAMAKAHMGDLTRKPDFGAFLGDLQANFGAVATRDAAYYAFGDALAKKLMEAPGVELDRLIDSLGVRGKLYGEHQQGFGKGTMPDPVNLPAAQQAQFEELAKAFPHNKGRTPAAYKTWFGPALRKRYAAIGTILDKVMGEAGKPPERSLGRSSIGPEDITRVNSLEKAAEAIPGTEDFTQLEYSSKPAFRTVTPEEARDLPTVQRLATTGAAIHGEARSVSRTLVAARDNATGKITLTSSWKDPRRGPVITNPRTGGDASVKLDNSWLANNRPFAVMQLREPVQHFRQVFENQAEFDKYFGDVGIEGSEGMHGGGSFTGPNADIAREAAGMNPKGRSGLAAAELPEALQPGNPPAPTGRELRMPRFARRNVPQATIPPGEPAPVENQMLPPGAKPEHAMEAPVPTFPDKLPYDVPQTTDRPITGPPSKMGVGWPLRVGVDPMLAKRSPAAFNKNVADELSAIGDTIKALIANRATGDKVARSIDDASNLPNNTANQIETGIRLQSAKKPGNAVKAKLTEWEKGDKAVLAGANAIVAAGGVRPNGTIDNHPAGARTKLVDFQRMVDAGLVKARDMVRNGNWMDRRVGRAWERNNLNLKAELDYAQAHWDDPEMQATASRSKLALDDFLAKQKKAGINVAEQDNYLPGRYDLSTWNGRSVFAQKLKIWGEKWREAKVFKNYYEAAQAGPYIAATRDIASLVGHAGRKALGLIARMQWLEGLKAVRTPEGKPLAMDAIVTPSGAHVSSSPNYEAIPVGGRFLAVHKDFVSLVRSLTSHSPFEDSPILKTALQMSQFIKHNLLIGDAFHMARMGYYAASLMGSHASWKKGWSVLDIAQRDMPEAIRRGVVTPEQAAWADAPIKYGNSTLTRRQLLDRAQANAVGFNIGRIQDSLYKDVLTHLTPSAGPVKQAISHLIDPTTGHYNRLLFDRVTRGFMAESFVSEFERQSAANPNATPIRLMRDISRDLNNYYGNIGRQGWFKSAFSQDLARMVLLAPQWVEGLIKKEAVGYGRITGAAKLSGARQGLNAFGSTGYGIGRGLLAMVALTQAINIISRRQPTWMNDEKEHRFDAYIPPMMGSKEGFFLSPMAVFNEMTHDAYRLIETKQTVMDAASQIAGNKESPLIRALLIAKTGQTEQGQHFTTSAGRLGAAAKSLAPVPITFGKWGQYAGNKLAPSLVSPPAPGALQRQALSTLGIKIEPAQGPVGLMAQKAREWMDANGLSKSKGFMEVATEEPSFAKLRSALRSGDEAEAGRLLQELQKNHKDVVKPMKVWAAAPFTGSQKAEQAFQRSLSPKDLETYSRAQADRAEQLGKFYDLLFRKP